MSVRIRWLVRGHHGANRPSSHVDLTCLAVLIGSNPVTVSNERQPREV